MKNIEKDKNNLAIFKVNENESCSFVGDLIHFLFFLFVFIVLNYVFLKFYGKLKTSWFAVKFPGIKGFLIFIFIPLLFNIILFYINFGYASQLIVYEDYFEICYLFRRKRIYFSELIDYKFKLSITGKDFELLYVTNKTKGFCAFYFSSQEINDYRTPEHVVKQLEEIFKKKVKHVNV